MPSADARTRPLAAKNISSDEIRSSKICGWYGARDASVWAYAFALGYREDARRVLAPD